MYVIGTAGHVDHGKSTLVKALTGIDPDRLEEEKRREMTIDLGFAWLKLPSGREISIVDVPGHERFIKNMLAGVAGFDAALLVIAADEGIMPQTQEHLDILKLLEIERGIIALTKQDMVDTEWLELIIEEIRERLSTTGLANAPIIPVSARTGFGLPILLQNLETTLDNIPPQTDIGRPRLPIDRVFSISGFGTVVTGTLSDGRLSIGQEIEIQPGNLRSRIRSLQMHKTKVETVMPGSRVAVNLTGLDVNDLARGMVLTIPSWLQATDLVDLRISVLADAPIELTQNSRWDFFSGAAEAQVGITILDKPKLLAGETGLLQARLSQPLALAKGDRFILRLPSPSQTVAGGTIIDPHPTRHKRFQTDVITSLQTLEKGTPAELILQRLNTGDGLPTELRIVLENVSLALKDAQSPINELVQQGSLYLLSDDSLSKEAAIQAGATLEFAPTQIVVSATAWQHLSERITAIVSQFHAQFPLKRGIGREELKSRLSIASSKIYNQLILRLLAQKVLIENGLILSLPNFEVRFNAAQQKQADNLLTAFQSSPYTPPNPHEIGIDPNIVNALTDMGKLKKVAEGIYFLADVYQEMLSLTLAELEKRDKLSLAEVRDLFGASRKPIQAFLEYLDDQKITRRIGDVRVKYGR